jgi:transposase-like protein
MQVASTKKSPATLVVNLCVSDAIPLSYRVEHPLPPYAHYQPIERAIQQEINRRTSKVRVFPNERALLRLVTAILVDLDHILVDY